MLFIDEYAIKKHIISVFISLLTTGVIFFYINGESLFFRFINESAYAEKIRYDNAYYGFSLSYPADYAVAENRGKDYMKIYFTPARKSPFHLQKSPSIFIETGDETAYLQNVKNRKNAEIVSVRNVTVGNNISARQIISQPKNKTGNEKLAETFFSRSGLVFVIWQNYDDKIDGAYPVLIKTFQFR